MTHNLSVCRAFTSHYCFKTTLPGCARFCRNDCLFKAYNKYVSWDKTSRDVRRPSRRLKGVACLRQPRFRNIPDGERTRPLAAIAFLVVSDYSNDQIHLEICVY